MTTDAGRMPCRLRARRKAQKKLGHQRRDHDVHVAVSSRRRRRAGLLRAAARCALLIDEQRLLALLNRLLANHDFPPRRADQRQLPASSAAPRQGRPLPSARKRSGARVCCPSRNPRADMMSGLPPGKSGPPAPRYRGQHRCGAIEANIGAALSRAPSSGPRSRGKTRPGGLCGRHQKRADAARQGSPTLKNGEGQPGPTGSQCGSEGPRAARYSTLTRCSLCAANAPG